jgi:hypothetical protein
VAGAAIRAAFEQRGEHSAAVELRRRFPGITDNAQALECARTIARLEAAVSAAATVGEAREAAVTSDPLTQGAVEGDTVRAARLCAVQIRGEACGSQFTTMVKQVGAPDPHGTRTARRNCPLLYSIRADGVPFGSSSNATTAGLSRAKKFVSLPGNISVSIWPFACIMRQFCRGVTVITRCGDKE